MSLDRGYAARVLEESLLRLSLGSYFTDTDSDTWTDIIDHPDFLVQARYPTSGNRYVLITNRTGSEIVFDWQASRSDFSEVRGTTICQVNSTFEIIGPHSGDSGERFIRVGAMKNTLATNKQKDTWWFDIIMHETAPAGCRVYAKMLKA